MTLVKGKNSYLTYEEAVEWLRLEGLETENLEKDKLEHNLIKATSKIESLNIKTICKEKGNLKFPLPYQEEVPLEVELCCVLEAYYMALDKESEELMMYKRGISSQSEKTASVSFDKSVIGKYKDIPFNNLEGYKLIEKYVSNSYRIK
jgi:phage gp36-like protein